MLACFLAGVILSACGDDGDEIFDNVDPQEENATDETKDKKEKPNRTIKKG